MTAHGWAIVTDDTIDVRTVNAKRKDAIVTYLIGVARVFPDTSLSDEEIEELWRRYAGEALAVRVKIETE